MISNAKRVVFTPTPDGNPWTDLVDVVVSIEPNGWVYIHEEAEVGTHVVESYPPNAIHRIGWA